MFWDLLYQRNIIFPNAYLVRREAFLRAHPTRQIFPSKEGQNWQLLLPLAYSCTYGYVNEPLGVYVERRDSHSRAHRDFQQWIERHNNFVELLLNTVREIPLSEQDARDVPYYIRVKYVRENLNLGMQNSARTIIEECLRTAQEYKLTVFNRYYPMRSALIKYVLPLSEPKRMLDWLMPFVGKARSRFCGEGNYLSKVKTLDIEGIEITDGFVDVINRENFYVILSDNYDRLKAQLIKRGFQEDVNFVDGRG